MRSKTKPVNTTGLRSATPILWIALVLVLLALLLPQALMARQAPDDPSPNPARRDFAETQFWVSGEFLEYFDAHGGLEVFGYPISAPYNERGILVQYFQNARMEWHAANEDPYKVQLGLLGDELGLRQPSVDQPPRSAGRVFFTETGHSVTYMFLRYFRSHGGVDLFGYPISEMLVENQQVVQYFQRLKLIWDPQTGRIIVGNLGDVYVNAHRSTLPFNVLNSLSYLYDDQRELELRMAIGLTNSVARSEFGQEVTVAVVDARDDGPRPNAQIKLVVSTEQGGILADLTRIVGTDDRGRAKLSIPLDGIEPGTWVVLQVEATDGLATATAEQLFLVWW
jgi:hypothetical protein